MSATLKGLFTLLVVIPAIGAWFFAGVAWLLAPHLLTAGVDVDPLTVAAVVAMIWYGFAAFILVVAIIPPLFR